jgi:hypothetical protein
MRYRWPVALAAALLGACAARAPAPTGAALERFEAVPDKAVVYLVRDPVDANVPTPVWLGELGPVTTYPGTYLRWETAPGRRQIAGYAGDHGALAFEAQAGKLYFVKQSLPPWSSVARSYFRLVGAAEGRAAVMRAEPLAPPAAP